MATPAQSHRALDRDIRSRSRLSFRVRLALDRQHSTPRHPRLDPIHLKHQPSRPRLRASCMLTRPPGQRFRLCRRLYQSLRGVRARTPTRPLRMGKTVRTEATPAILKVLLPDDPPAVPNRQVAELLSFFSVSTNKRFSFQVVVVFISSHVGLIRYKIKLGLLEPVHL